MYSQGRCCSAFELLLGDLRIHPVHLARQVHLRDAIFAEMSRIQVEKAISDNCTRTIWLTILTAFPRLVA